MSKLVVICCCAIAVLCGGAKVFALPPLGLTQIAPGSFALEIIDGTAYITALEGIRTVSSTGELGFIAVSHPTLGIPAGVSLPVKAGDGQLYVAANFGDPTSFNTTPALYKLSEPATPIVTWDHGSIRGVDVNLRTFGNVETGIGDFGHEATWFYSDGSTEALPYPPGSDNTNNVTLLIASTPRSYAIGEAGIPMTAGSGPVMWDA